MEARQNVIWRHVERFLRTTSTSWATFGTEVRRQYERTVGDGSRLVEWSTHRDTAQRMTLDGQTVRRFAHDYPGSACRFDMPVEAEEAMVFALGELGYTDYQTLLTELAERFGMLPVMIPVGGPLRDLHLVAKMMKEGSESIEAVAQLTANDGVINTEDPAKKLRHAQIQIRELMAVLAVADKRVSEALHAKGMGMPAPVRVVK